MQIKPHRIQLTCIDCGTNCTALEEEKTAHCQLCQQEFEAVFVCEKGHYICHDCRQKEARERIIRHCLGSLETQPFALMDELMRLPNIAMHGPEHHLLLTAALLTAYGNQTKRDDLPDLLEEANQRSLMVPGGACGLLGICGAAIGAGIFSSLLTEAEPQSEQEWKECGTLTATCAHDISAQGGPRCCKRDSFTSFIQAANYANEHLGVQFTIPSHIRCEFFPNNPDCKGKACPFMRPEKPAKPVAL